LKLRAIWLTGLTALTLLAGLGLYLAPLKPDLVALQFAFSPERFGLILVQWGPEGVALFRSHLPIDGILLLCYGAFGYLLAMRTRIFSNQSKTTIRWLALLMPLAALADSGENLLHWLLTGSQAQMPTWVYALAGLCASLKWVGLVLFTVATVWAVVWRRQTHINS
jgi:hypothetical protein